MISRIVAKSESIIARRMPMPAVSGTIGIDDASAASATPDKVSAANVPSNSRAGEDSRMIGGGAGTRMLRSSADADTRASGSDSRSAWLAR
jgi:hypothetical protein